jgi:hypothetical protein
MRNQLQVRLGLFVWTVIGCACVVLLPASAAAQASISGLVQDSTGGVLPGVTVEAVSPVMIEGSVSAVTDGSGRYTIVNLRPGTFKVTFSMQGFNRLVREDILLVGDGAVQVNGELRVGALEESVTVAAASPIVDVQQTRRQFVATREVLDTIPTARTIEARSILIPGVRNTGMAEGQYWPTVHGSAAGDALTYNDGMRATSVIDDGNYKIGWMTNDAASAEMTYETGGAPAAEQVGGMIMNVIPKEGGNTFAGTSFVYYGSGDLQNDNRTPELAKVVRATSRLGYSVHVNPAFGGPIKRNRLWFFTSFQHKDDKNFVTDQFFKTGPLGMGHDGEQAFNRGYQTSGLLRLTHQVTPKHKWRIGFERLNNFAQFQDVTATRPPESSNFIPQPVGYHAQARWTSTLTNRLLLEAGYATQYNKWRRHPQTVLENLPTYYEVTNGQYSGGFSPRGWQPEGRQEVKASLTYATGSHNIKAGVGNTWGYIGLGTEYPADVRTILTFNGAPYSIEVLSTPLGSFRAEINRDLGAYVQDQWTIRKWTLNLGTRFDNFYASIPPQSAGAGTWVGARDFPAFPGPTWNNLVGRFGVAYDLFGNGKTAIKANASQFVAGEGTRLTSLRNPMASQTWAPNGEYRTFNDIDRSGFIIDPLTGRIQREEVGPSPNRNFGSAADTTTLDPHLKREAHWEYSASLQHQLITGLSVTAGFYRRDYYNLQYSDNLAQSHSDYTPFDVTVPFDPRLPGGGGEVITRYNLDPAVFGRSDRYVGNSDINDRIYTGFEMAVNGRLRGAFFGGSVTTERTESNTCQVDDPNSLRFCHLVPPFRTLFKAMGMYPLPGGVNISAFLQGYPGPSLASTYSITSAIAGRTLTNTTISTTLVEPQSEVLPFQTNLDVRIMRRFKVGHVRINPSADIFNLLNVSTTSGVNGVYGPGWQNITSIFQPRRLRLGVEVDF